MSEPIYAGERLALHIDALTAERDAAVAENAKLREAFGLLADFTGVHRATLEVDILPALAADSDEQRLLRQCILNMENDEVEARTALGQYEEAARALVEAPR
jgi:hypothetical protein